MESLYKFLSAIGDIASISQDPVLHFGLAFCVGALAYLLTSTISYASILAWERGTRRKANSGAVFGILIFCLLVAISFAVLSHGWLDGLWDWYNMPLGPPLELVI